MAFFGGHDTEDINVTLENSAIYESEVGLGVIALECTQFEAEIFGDCVRSDMKEYALVQEGADVEAFQEGAWETVKTKVVEFVKKVWAKVKAFFNGWYAKVAARVMSDNKAFYNKFKKSVESKDYSKLEVKWEAPQSYKCDSKGIDGLSLDALKDADAKQIIEKVYDLDETVSSHAEAKKVILKHAFKDEETVAYSTVANAVVEELTGAKSVREAQSEFKKANNKLASEIKKLESEKKGTENIAMIANAVAKAHVTCLEAKVAVAKKTASQARRTFAKLVAYSPKTEGAEFDMELFMVEADSLMVD
jgi:hypothetical protein